MKEIIILAGANGSGKTTIAKEFLKKENFEFLNADEIEKAMPVEEKSALKAGRLFFEKFRNLIDENKNFIIETTLSGRYLLKFIAVLKQKKYAITLVFVFLQSPKTCIDRIKYRVKKGGHGVPDADVIRRYYRGIDNFWNEYRIKADLWYLFYNSNKNPQRIAFGYNSTFYIENNDFFEIFLNNIKNIKL